MDDIFDGDGRKTLYPPTDAPGRNPRPVRRGAAQRMIENFEQVGRSLHPSRDSAVWVVVKYCQIRRIPHTIKVVAGGFIVEKETDHAVDP